MVVHVGLIGVKFSFTRMSAQPKYKESIVIFFHLMYHIDISK